MHSLYLIKRGIKVSSLHIEVYAFTVFLKREWLRRKCISGEAKFRDKVSEQSLNFSGQLQFLRLLSLNFAPV